MRYIFLIHIDEAAMAATRTADPQAMMSAYLAYTTALKEADVWRGGEALNPAAAGVAVKVKDGKTSVVNGPYSEAREQLGGYYLIEAPDLDAAIAWAARCPGAAQGVIEVRPVWSV